MTIHKLRPFALVLVALALSASALAVSLYEISLRNGATVLSRGQPTEHGTILVFRGTDGRLTGLPREEVVAVRETGTAAVTRTTTTTTTTKVSTGKTELRPGDTLVLGPTGGEGSASAPGAPASANPTAPGTPAGAGSIYGGGNLPPQSPTTAANQPAGFPANAPVTSIGPDGLPRGLGSGPPPTAGASTAPAGTIPPGSNIQPVGTTNPRGTTMSPAGTTPPGSNIEPAGTTNPRGSSTTAPAGSTPPGTALPPAPPPAAAPPPAPAPAPGR
jgi:hypothetical protein